MDALDGIARAAGGHLLRGEDAAPWARDWTGAYVGAPLAVARPGSTAEVAAVMSLAHAARLPVVPAGGRTGLTGATHAPGALVLSLDRMRRVRAVRAATRVAVAEAGVVVADLGAAAEAHGLAFPLAFGARRQAQVGGILATNAGGANVLRHGSARDLCLGVEAVLADGRVLDLMSETRKDNAGYALRHLLVGSEGTLAVITAAVLRLVARPLAHATAMLAVRSLPDALALLRRAEDEVGGVEAFEWMPRSFIEGHLALDPAAREPFAGRHEVNVLVEAASTAPRDAVPGPAGQTPLAARLESLLAAALDEGVLLDAVVAGSEGQRRALWARREAAARIAFARTPFVDTDVAVPLDAVEEAVRAIRAAVRALDPGATDLIVAHLGDGNLHYTAYPTHDAPEHLAAVRAAIDGAARALGGSFSAEHGVGLSKLPAMRAFRDPAALDAMRAVKRALDPEGLLNPGKVLP